MTRRTIRCGAALTSLVVTSLFATAPILAQSGARDGEWRHWGADGGTTHYSPLDWINRHNVADLQIAWRWRSHNFGPRPDFEYRATPLMVGGVLYTTAGSRRDVVAIDAATGETLWMFRYDEGSRGQRAPNRGLSGRGVACWADDQGNERLFYVSRGYRLVALNPKTGRPAPDFGQDGVVDLWEALDQDKTPQEGDFSLTSPPTVVGDVVVVGAAMRQSAIADFPRGFDVRSGRRLWTFHTIPQEDEFGNDSWEAGSWRHTGNTGVWAPISVDEELGYVYLGVETPTNDWYGGGRLGDNLFANSLVCVDAKTGERVWHFQLTHHDIWDYDIPAAANLVDIIVNGETVKAVAQVTKQSFAYVLDRVTAQGLPLVKPPWSRITAIDLNTGEHVWMIPNGAAPAYISDHPALRGVDLSNAGTGDNSGLLVTKSLLFAGQGAAVQGVHPGAGGRMFRAIDKKTGEVIAELELPANQSDVPMTYWTESSTSSSLSRRRRTSRVNWLL